MDRGGGASRCGQDRSYEGTGRMKFGDWPCAEGVASCCMGTVSIHVPGALQWGSPYCADLDGVASRVRAEWVALL